MTVIKHDDENFVKSCIYALTAVIALISVLTLFLLLSSCDSQQTRQTFDRIIKKDEAEIKHIISDDLKEVADELDKEYPKSNVQEEVKKEKKES
jgi:hypothetical protein